MDPTSPSSSYVSSAQGDKHEATVQPDSTPYQPLAGASASAKTDSRSVHYRPVLAAIVETRINPDKSFYDGWKCLKQAVLQNNVKKVLSLLQDEAIDLNHKDGNGKTILHIAVSKNNLKVVEILARCSKVDLNNTNKDDESALMSALYTSYAMVKLLSAVRGVDLNQVKKNNLSALILAVNLRRPEVVKLLSENPRVDVNLECKGNTALSVASGLADKYGHCNHRHKEIIDILSKNPRVNLHQFRLTYFQLPENAVMVRVPFFEGISIRNGCGLKALEMVLGYWEGLDHGITDFLRSEQSHRTNSERIEESVLVSIAHKNEYCSEGELFAGRYLAEIARHCDYKAKYYKESDIGKVYEILDRGIPVILPYDADKKASVAYRNGETAHYAVIEGYFDREGVRYIIAKHSEFPDEDLIWDAVKFEASWLQLNQTLHYEKIPMPTMILLHLDWGSDYKMKLAPEPVRDKDAIATDLMSLIQNGKLDLRKGQYFQAQAQSIGIQDTLAGFIIEVSPKSDESRRSVLAGYSSVSAAKDSYPSTNIQQARQGGSNIGTGSSA